ncbi:MAG: pilus assembly protein [Selenomonadaceae bacterium]|nr:pilus assembly protein [Selenomonadaceae bacterium]
MNHEPFVKGTPSKNFFRQRGQVMLLFALFVPLLFLFAGMGIDLGWYYLNVSRLQNAADAAVLAGAKSLLKQLQDNSSNYKSYKVALVYQHPDESNLYTVSSLTKSSTKSTTADATDITAAIKSTADKAAVQYARKNLSSNNVSSSSQSFFSVAEAAETDEAYSMEDSWARKNRYNEIKMDSPQIYKDGDDFYYVVQLQEDIQHLFMPGWFDPMDAPVIAVAKISKETSSTSSGNAQIVFDPNGGKFVNPNDGTTTTARLSIGDINKAIKESGSAAVIVPDGYSSTPEREEYEFLRYWTNENGLIVPYGTVLTADNIEEFFKTYDPAAQDNDDYDWKNGSIVLYAQWVKVKQQPVNLVFDPNGGSFSDGTTSTDSKQIKNPKEMEDSETTDPITPNKGKPTREGYEFYGWSTDKNADANSLVANYIPDGKQLTKTEVINLFGDNTSVTLYAVWEEEVKPHNNKTLWEQMQYLIAKYVYDGDWSVSTQKYTTAPDYIQFSNVAEKSLEINTATDKGKNIKDIDRLFLDFHVSSENSTQLLNPSTRHHALIKVKAAYDVRAGKNDDPLYIRIESEPAHNAQGGAQGNSPQQIIININKDNTADSKRPLFFYYDGPLEDREPQPLILNLNTDFKGVLWMPDIPVVINGNGHTFEGFIVAKEYRYLSTSGNSSHTKEFSKRVTVKSGWSTKTITIPLVDDKNNIQTTKATGSNALELYNNNGTDTSKFHLSSSSKFRTFKTDTNVKFMYVFYDNNKTLDETPFHEYGDLSKDLIPLYKLDEAGNQIRVTNWADVKLYDSGDFATRNEIPQQINSIRTVRLDSDGNPAPLYDEAGNPVYFCEDYVKLTGTYTVFTLDKVAEGIRNEKEFLLTKTDALNVPNTDDWK